MIVPRDLRYALSHEWVRVKGNVATVGISDFAQHQLSELTFVELPAVGDEVVVSDEVGVVESVKAASDIYAPVSGTVLEINDEVLDHPESVNSDPYGAGWLFKIQMKNPGEVNDLLDGDSYEEQLPEEE
ncbi:MAG: glycine cleavage system protein GcvH [Kiritimatiellae bacterium]|nr:glycine cleavage system protein GcvH [Kiritimatiellia bacterium]